MTKVAMDEVLFKQAHNST